MTLKEYMEASGLDDDAFAAMLGDCSGFAVKKWKYGERRPRSDQMRRIFDVTGGKVSANDFFGLPDDPEPARAPA